ncbi:daunorubicin ABC transporter ATP-binding protein, partial [Halobacteriales archaeon QS_1_68_44]
MSDRETWATRLGFILASIGSAVGLGNIWRFPFQTAENGGAAFLVVYLAAVIIIGLPALLAEFVIGRRANINAIDAFDRLNRPSWKVVGGLGVFAGFWTMAYYSVVGGWVIRYVYGSVTGAYFETGGGDYFGTISAGPDAVALHFLFMAITVGIVAFGIEDGIEKATKVMVPSIVLLMIGLAAYAATLPGGSEGYGFFLSPDFGTIAANAGEVIPAAVGQALFSLSLGFSVMITYASYIGDDENLGVDGVSIAAFNTFVGVFISVADALAGLPASRVLGVVFFGVVLIAALSSAISLLEVVTAYVVDNYRFGRVQTATGIGALLFLTGLPSALDTAWLEWADNVGASLLLPLAALGVVFFIGWVVTENALNEVRQGTDGAETLSVLWLWSLRTVVLAAV